MTITATPSQVSYAGDGVSTALPIPFVFDTSDDIKVVLTSAAGVPAVLSTGFSITGGGGSTGTLTMLVAPAVGETLTVLDDPELTQSADYINNGSFPAESHERALDHGIRLTKRLHQRVNRSIRVDDGDLSDGDDLITPISSVRAGKFLAFDSSGNPTVSAGTGGGDVALRNDLASALSGADGSRLIGYRRTESGAGPTTAYAIFNRQIWLADFQAVENGIADDTTSMNNAIAACVARGGGEIIVKGDTVIKNVAWASKVSLKCINGARIFVDAAAANDYAILMHGTTGAASSLTANAARGAKSVTVASAVGFAVGNYALLRSNEFISGPDGRKQQINLITSIAGNVVTFREALMDPFTTAAASELVVCNPISNVKFTDVRIFNRAVTLGGGVSMNIFADIDLGNIEVSGSSARAAIRMETGTGVDAWAWLHDCLGGSPGSSIGLGFFIINCDHIRIHKGTRFENVTENSFEMRSRWCEASFNARNVRDSGFNTHGNGNHDIDIHDFTVDGSDGVGVAIGFTGHVIGDIRITVRDGKIANTVSHGVSSSGAVGKTNKHCKIRNIECSGMLSSGAGTVYAATVAWNDDLTVENLHGDCTTLGTSDPSGTFNASNCTRLTIKGGSAKNAATGFGLQITNCASTKLVGVDLSANANHVSTTGSTGTNYVTDCLADSSVNSIEATWNSWGSPWDSGTFTLTSTGVTGAPTDNAATYTVGPNNVVSFTSQGIATGVSTAVTMTATGLPARLWPTDQRRINGIYVTDNGTDCLGRLTVETNGVITFAKDAFAAAFTAAGQKGWKRFAVSYPRT